MVQEWSKNEKHLLGDDEKILNEMLKFLFLRGEQVKIECVKNGSENPL